MRYKRPLIAYNGFYGTVCSEGTIGVWQQLRADVLTQETSTEPMGQKNGQESYIFVLASVPEYLAR